MFCLCRQKLKGFLWIIALKVVYILNFNNFDKKTVLAVIVGS